MKANTIFFKAIDGVQLKGFIYGSKNKTKKILISIHGMATNCLKYRDEKIAEKINKLSIDFLAFNNRGNNIINIIKKTNKIKELAGTAYEEISECYEDILGAINYAISKGYEQIYLLGHSLGATKVVYFYNKLKNTDEEMLKKIKGILLLSLIDIPFAIQFYLQDRFQSITKYAKNMQNEGMESILMPEESFIYPISVKNFLRYTVNNADINFAKYSEKENDFKELNCINVPLFMRWGNNNEMIFQKANNLCDFLKTKINNSNLDIGFIEGADHSYTKKEEKLAEEIYNFISQIIVNEI